MNERKLMEVDKNAPDYHDLIRGEGPLHMIMLARGGTALLGSLWIIAILQLLTNSG